MRRKLVWRYGSAWLCTLGTANFISAWAQTGAPAGNPLDTLPQATQLLNQTWATSPSPPTLAMSKGLQPVQPMQQEVQANNIQISGVHALPFETIAAFFQPLSGQRTTIAALANAVGLATEAYQKAGYPLSFVYLPEQTFEGGIVRVIAVEGHINQVVLQGDTGKSQALLAAMAQPMLEQKPLTREVFERQTILMSRLDNLKVGVAAAIPTTTDGGTPLTLTLDRSPVLFNVGADLRQGDPKAVATLTLNDPLWGGSQWQLTSLIDDWNEERFISATMNETLNADGTRLSLNASDFKGQDNYAGNLLQDITSQRKISLGITHPLHLSNTRSTIVGVTLFGLNYQKEYSFPGLNLNLTDEEKVRALQAHWNWQKFTPQSHHSASATFTQGMDALGASLNRSSLLLANKAKLDFSRLSFDYAYRWKAKNRFGASFGMGGQASPHTVPTSERVSFGGSRFGHGYRSGEAAGDQGLGVSLEANRQFIFPHGTWLKSLEPYILYEHARTWFHEAGWASQKLESSSLGLRLSDNKYYAVDVAVSKPHGDKSPYNPQQKLRYSMSLTYQFGH